MSAPQPGQHPQFPQQPAPGYVLNGQSAQLGQPGVGHPVANPAGRVGLILGLVAIVLNILVGIVFQVMIRSAGFELYPLINGIGNALVFAAALAALILGLIGLRRAGAPHAAAGIAVGIGLAIVIGTAFGFLTSLIGSLMYF